MGLAPSRVLELVEQFHRNRDEYRKHGLNETQLHREYLDPFFEALGWDVANREGNAPAYREVIHEDAVRIGGVEKAPDYSFRVGGTRKFFVEAKNPSINLKDDPRPAYQLRRYAWSARLPLSILSDFEEFVVYDCRTRPAPTDKPSAGRSLYLTYRDYETRWDEIASIFAKESVLKGSFDKYAASERKRGTATVDKEFLAEIEQWRELLAKNLAVRNQALSAHDLNFSVQRTIDRIIFLRICEDRGVEHYGQLQSLLNGEHTYERLRQLFSQADDRYNSGLFHFQREAGRAEAPNELTPRLKIEDKTLKHIIERLYAPKSPYEFSVFPAEILGQVYEQFLGKVIRLTAGHQAKVEEKPEVKKAGGVYYTPAYIVDYIVKHTVGALCDGKTPKQIAKLRILDPACGSGSFLIGAYQYLLTYHRDWYVSDGPDQHKKELFKTRNGDWRLKSEEKKRILLNNIYGVDIDSQAVEVTKLSLLLKVLEGENEESLQELLFGRVRVLPDLGKNIKCGNSLIGPDYFTGQLLSDEEEESRINPFDWRAEFAEIMQAGGFDAVIGNPPYGFHQIHSERVKTYFKAHYLASQGSFEHYFLFYEAALNLLKAHGMHGFIVPVTWLTIPSARSLRKFILERFAIREISWLPELVFANAQVNTLISIIARDEPNSVRVKIYDSLELQSSPQKEFIAKQARFANADYAIGIFEDESDTGILSKIVKAAVPLDSLAKPCSGYNPYEVGKGERPEGGRHDKHTVETRPYHSTRQKGTQWKPEIVGRDFGRPACSRRLTRPTERSTDWSTTSTA
ncbi:MAG: N-6 DNA methylase [Nitrospirota bacterium]|nr:N-6 DNA methylase [Nitrospirota bacterium]